MTSQLNNKTSLMMSDIQNTHCK